jgi:hypothetical protein
MREHSKKMSLLNQPIVFTFLLIFGVYISAASAQTRPPAPYSDRGACPFECCTYRQWTVDKATVIRSAMSDSSPVAFRLAKGERVRGITGVVITSQPGIAEGLKATEQNGVRIRRGDQIYLYTNLGEGFVKGWLKGRFFQAEVLDSDLFKIVRQPRSVWWVKVRNRQGKIGWSREPEHFGNMDQCG